MSELYQNTHQATEAATTHDKPGWPSGRAMIEPPAHEARCAVMAGSLPVFDAELFSAWLTRKITECNNRANAAHLETDYANTVRMRNYAAAYETAKLHLRWQMAFPDQRQPEENK